MAACLLAFRPLANAQQNMTPARGPATSTPSSGNCGLPSGYTEQQQRKMVEAIAGVVANALDRRPAVKWDAGRSTNPGHVVLGPKKKNAGGEDMPRAEEIWLNASICDITHTQAEAAWVIAHEFGHLQLEHMQKSEAKEADYEKECGGRNNDCWKKKMDELWAPFEDQADLAAVANLKKVPEYKDQADAAGQTFFKHMRDLYAVVGIEQKVQDDAYHSSPEQRAAQLRAAALNK